MATRAKASFSSTEEDIYRNQAFESSFSAQFFGQFADKDYEYKVKEGIIDRKKHHPAYVEKQKLMKTYRDALYRNNILITILQKRALTPDEIKLKRTLEAKVADETINEKEELNLRALKNIEPRGDHDRNAQEIFRGLNEVHYYLEARKNLKPGASFQEWDRSITRSLEPLVLDETRRCLTAVITGDLISEYANLQTKGFNPVIVCWGSKLQPGADWDKGIMSTEAELFFRTSASVAFTDEVISGFYPLLDEGLLFARKIFAYRSQYSQEFALINEEKRTFFPLILCSPEYLEPGSKELTETQEDRLKAKLRNIFQTALYWGYDSIIMNPIGVGAPFNYPAESSVNIYKYVLFGKKNLYYHKFKRIVFVSPDAATDRTILAPLSKAEQTLQLEEIAVRDRVAEYYRHQLNGMTHEI